MAGRVAHAAYEVEQVLLISVGGVATHAFNSGADIDAFAVEFYPAAVGAVALYFPPWGAFRLVAGKHYAVAFVAKHVFEVVDYPAAAGHAAGGDDHGGASCLGQVLQGAFVGLVVLYDMQVVEAERVAAAA